MYRNTINIDLSEKTKKSSIPDTLRKTNNRDRTSFNAMFLIFSFHGVFICGLRYISHQPVFLEHLMLMFPVVGKTHFVGGRRNT